MRETIIEGISITRIHTTNVPALISRILVTDKFTGT